MGPSHRFSRVPASEETALSWSAAGAYSGPSPRRPLSARGGVRREGFSTSICSMFSDPARRSDCCALACCGVLASDRTRYLVLGQRPAQSWAMRFLLYAGLPLGLYRAGDAVIASAREDEWAARCRAAFPGDGSRAPDLSAFDGPVDGVEGLGPRLGLGLALVASSGIAVACLLARARRSRSGLRRDILERLRALEEQDQEQAHGAAPGASGGFHGHETSQAAGNCGCYRIVSDDGGSQAGTGSEPAATNGGDLCSCLWSVLSSLFCRACCQCWCQWCGMCGTAQEEREIPRLVPEEKWRRRVDYITFQPHDEYLPGLEGLRARGEGSILRHFEALSELSARLVRAGGVALLLLAIWALSGVDGQFTPAHLGIVVATLAQSLLLLYLVHWRWHRLDLSLDAVIKCFASGFFFSSSTAIVVEVLVSLAASCVTALLGLLAIVLEIELGLLDEPTGVGGIDQLKPSIVRENAWLGVLAVLLNAFVVAAMVEELCKYFGYWMVEHPDLLNDGELANGGGSCGAGGAEAQGGGAVRRDLNSRGVGITAGMVATAIGFSCCENLKYVLASADVGVELSTLAARSLLPVHALAAALQSVGVCRRDLEGDRSHRLGRIILPALLLHGSFDFFLMVAPIIVAVRHVGDLGGQDDGGGGSGGGTDAPYGAYLRLCEGLGTVDGDVWKPQTGGGTDPEGGGGGDDPANGTDAMIGLVSFGLSLLSVLAGGCLYVVASRRQRHRLELLERDGTAAPVAGLVAPT